MSVLATVVKVRLHRSLEQARKLELRCFSVLGVACASDHQSVGGSQSGCKLSGVWRSNGGIEPTVVNDQLLVGKGRLFVKAIFDIQLIFEQRERHARYQHRELTLKAPDDERRRLKRKLVGLRVDHANECG